MQRPFSLQLTRATSTFIVRFLVENGADKDQTDNNGATPLSVAAQSGHLDIVQFLVEVGAEKMVQRPFSVQL